MRFFTTEGPVNCEDHYCLPPLARFDLAELLKKFGGAAKAITAGRSWCGECSPQPAGVAQTIRRRGDVKVSLRYQ